MRIFKSISVYLLTTVICFGCISCSGDDGEKFIPQFSIHKEKIVIYENGGEGVISYQSNIDIKSFADDWIVLKNKTDENGIIKQKFEVKPLTERKQQRKGFIKLTSSQYNIKDSVEVTQLMALYIQDDYNFETYVTEKIPLSYTNETGEDVIWKSSDENIVSVSDGIIKVLKEGSATITAATTDGSHNDKIIVDAYEITTKLSCKFKTRQTGMGGSWTIYTDCNFYNDSKRDVNIKGLKVSYGKDYCMVSEVEDHSLLGLVKANESKYLYMSKTLIGINEYKDDYIFEYTIEFNGKEYVCKYPHHVDLSL